MLPVRFGERGKAVATVQQRLDANRVCVPVDGDFGPTTRRAVVAFQRTHGLAAAGVVGPGPGAPWSPSAAGAAPPAAREEITLAMAQAPLGAVG